MGEQRGQLRFSIDKWFEKAIMQVSGSKLEEGESQMLPWGLIDTREPLDLKDSDVHHIPKLRWAACFRWPGKGGRERDLHMCYHIAKHRIDN